MKTELPVNVREVLSSYPAEIQEKIHQLRELIFQTASAIDAVGPVTETLKWGEPAYLTEDSKSGSTIRIGWKEKTPAQYAMYFNCRTSLVDTFRTLFPELQFEGNRAVIFRTHDELPVHSVAKCIELALTYHVTKRTRR